MKRIRILRAAAVLLVFILALSPCAVFAANMSQNIREAVTDYLDARRELLLTGDSTALSAIANDGIVRDELAHRESIAGKDLVFPEVNYVIDYIAGAYDNAFTVRVREVAKIAPLEEPAYELDHILMILMEPEIKVVSDSYQDPLTGFESCSWVPMNHAHTVDLQFTPCRADCFIHVARQEIGYLEKASNHQLDSHSANHGDGNFTKYGQWYGMHSAGWGGTFISWCANQTGIPTDVIPRESNIQNMIAFYKQNGNYFSGSDYIPKPGDLIFFNDGDNYQAGIVESVTGYWVHAIVGNWDGQVASYTYLREYHKKQIGYASLPLYDFDHYWVGENGEDACLLCGKTKD